MAEKKQGTATVGDGAEKTQEKRVGVQERKEKITIGVDKSDAAVLQMNQDAGVELVWDELNFRRLDSKVVDQLKPANMKAYLMAENKADARAAAYKKVQVVQNPLNPISGYSQAREYIRPRAGWHQAWANPGRDFDEKMRGPYKQVRKPTEAQVKDGYEPGEESGEVIKRLDGEGKVEAIALECPEHLFQQYLKWMSDKSGAQKVTVKENFFGAVENINREIPDRSSRIVPLDLEGDLQV